MADTFACATQRRIIRLGGRWTLSWRSNVIAIAETSGRRRPADLSEAVRYFSDVEVANEFVASLRWPGGRVCPRCGSGEHSYISTRRLWKCKECKRQFSVKVGTVFEGSTLGLDKWLPAVWIVANPEHALSSRELARALGVTQKSAWFMLRRIRLAMGET